MSVVVPAYRAAATVGRALGSVLAQTCRPAEVLVIDDGSPDDLAGAVAPFGGAVRLVRQANGGAASARNRGLDLAAGAWVAFLDADDYWEPAKLERQLAAAGRHPEVALVAGRFMNQEPGGPRNPPPAGGEGFYDRVLRPAADEALDVARRVWTSAALVRRAALGGERFDAGLRTAEDVDLWLRLALRHPVYLLGEPLATQVLEGGSLSRSDVAGDCRNMLAVIRRHAGRLGPAAVRRWEAAVYKDWAAGHLGAGEAAAAVAPSLRRLARQPWSAEGAWIVAKSLGWSATTALTGVRPVHRARGEA